MHIIYREKDIPDIHKYDVYVKNDGYAAYKKALGMDPKAVIDEVAPQLREAAGEFDAVGIRFVLPGYDQEREALSSHYAWKLYVDGEQPVTSFSGLAPSDVRELVDAYRPGENERLDGLWLNSSHAFGLVAMTSHEERKFLYMLPLAPDRYHLQEAKGGWSATHREGEFGTFKADGVETDEFSVRLQSDGALGIYDNADMSGEPWLIVWPVAAD